MAKSKAKAPPSESTGILAAGTTDAAEYTVVARRYRPQQFGELIGQEPVAQLLVNALKSGRVAHAYLFTGARGVGKTSTARILAKALNCAQGPTPTPCDRCDSCQAIAAGQDVDVLEIDGASNRRIEEVRDIRQNVQFRPSRSRYKIYIIDEVHMLTKEAFNALLKTLEEPPQHVKFIFATTDVQKVPITILSRCQRFDFAGIAGSRIVQRLREVVQGEGMQADDEALEMVARRAGGSMRDAQSLLDQLLAFGADRLTIQQVHGLLGTADEDFVASIASAILAKDVAQALALVAGGADRGIQFGELVDQLIEYWRDLMLLGCGGPEVAGINAASRFRDQLSGHAKSQPVDSVLAGLDILNSTKMRLRGSAHARTLVEMALVRLTRLDDLVALSQIAQALQGGADSLPPATRGASAAPGQSITQISVVGDGLKKKPGELTAAAAPLSAVPLTAESLPQIWPEILTQVGPMLARELIRAGLPAISGPNHLLLTFPNEYNRQGAYCADTTRVQRVQDALKRVTGQEWSIRVEMTKAMNGLSTQESIPSPVTGTEAPTGPKAELFEQPLLQRVIDVFGAKLVRADPNFGQVAETDSDDVTAETITSEET